MPVAKCTTINTTLLIISKTVINEIQTALFFHRHESLNYTSTSIEEDIFHQLILMVIDIWCQRVFLQIYMHQPERRGVDISE